MIFPQFATHNAQSLATIYHLAGPDFAIGDYEFQCLHGMGEGLYGEVVGAKGLARPCRIYAPVGTHETLLAYLVRRLLENGANSSFVNRIADPAISIDEMVVDPVDVVRAMPVPGAGHDEIALPAGLYSDRRNSAGLDLANENALAALTVTLQQSASRLWTAAMPDATDEERRTVLNPADQRDVVGWVQDATPDQARLAVARAALAAPSWAAVPVVERAARLERAADAMQVEIGTLIGLLVREAGKSVPNAIAEVREAIDFLRYYAGQARTTLEGHRPLGVITCISPWNFPLAIFTGQIAAALVAGSSVLAKPAEETPLIAAEAVRLLHGAGIPTEVLQLVPGAGEVGAALVEASQTAAVMFTGSTEVARLIQKTLSKRLSALGQPIPLIAETGGQNAMIVDSSALAEQVVGDVIASAFDSAGQRCSALRILCLQEDVADHVLKMLKGALKELTLGNTDRLSVDVGPVITQEAKDNIERHISAMSARGLRIEQIGLAPGAEHGTFVAPTIIEIERLSDVEREVFGPVLHVLRFRRDRLDTLIDDINASGFGLTFGLHTRLDETIAHVTSRVQAGNLYINRNVIGAIVGVQPFGGRGLSGTGPKAGGPLYLGRLVETAPALPQGGGHGPASAIVAFADWLAKENMEVLARQARAYAAQSPLGMERELEGPVGERNIYALHPRGRVLLLPSSDRGLCNQLAALLATGNDAVIPATPEWQRKLAGVPTAVAERLSWAADWTAAGPFAGALVEGDAEAVREVLVRLAALPGPIVSVQLTTCEAMPLHWLLEEVSTSINTTAAGGNASLMAIG